MNWESNIIVKYRQGLVTDCRLFRLSHNRPDGECCRCIGQALVRSHQDCTKAAKRPNRILGMIKRKTVSKDQDVVLRPHLEFCVQNWSPCLRQDLDKL